MNENKVLFGRVIMQMSNAPSRYESVLVKKDGDYIGYYLGSPPANTSDGFVKLPEEYLDKVQWDERYLDKARRELAAQEEAARRASSP